MKKLILLFLLPLYVVAEYQGNLKAYIIRINYEDNAKYEFYQAHNDTTATFLKIWKIVEKNDTAENVHSTLVDTIPLKDSILRRYADFYQIVWMVKNPNIDTVVSFRTSSPYFVGKPNYFPVREMLLYKVRYQKSLSYSNLDKKFKFTESDKVIVENGYASFKFATGFLIAGLIITLGAVCLIKFSDASNLSFLLGLFIQVISVLQYLEWIGYLLYPAIAGCAFIAIQTYLICGYLFAWGKAKSVHVL
jgi:hypothetical protein